MSESAAPAAVPFPEPREEPPAQRAAPVAAATPVNWSKLILGFAGMVIGQFMAILDIQIVASSLPQIQTGISASADEVSWVQTAYLIPEVVMIPLSGFLSRAWGTQRLFMLSCIGFVAMSVLTGFSTSIDMIIVTRALQGFLGGAMIPTVFATAFTAFPPEKRILTSVIMGMIVTLAPTIGPTLGGHLSEALSWRWLFFVNVFPGMLVLFLVGRYADFDKGDPALAKRFDWLGLGLMAAALMSMQYVLEEGSRKDWFQDPLILGLTVLSLVSGVWFVRRSLKMETPIVELRALGDRNFALGVAITFIVGAALFGGTFLLPLFLSRVRNYSSAEVGTTMIVSGLSMFVAAPLVGRLVAKLDRRIPIFVGFMLVALSMWQAHEVTADWGFWQFAGVQAIRGGGIMLAMIAAQQMTMSTLPPHMVKNASGIVNLGRNVGGAVGLAVLNSWLSDASAAHYVAIDADGASASGGGLPMLAGLEQRMTEMGVADPHGAALKVIQQIIAQRAETVAFGDMFAVVAVACLAAAIFGLFAKPVKPGVKPSAPAEAH